MFKKYLAKIGGTKLGKIVFGLKSGSWIRILVVAAVAVAGVYFGKSFLVAAIVNGEPVFRLSVISQLEKQGGASILDSLVTKALILQEAKKQKITVEKSEIDAEVAKLEANFTSQGQNIDSILEEGGMDRDDLAEQIRVQKLIVKLLGDQLKIEDSEVKTFITDNTESFPEGMSEEEKDQMAREQLEQQKVSEKFQPWINDLKNQAKINYFVKY